MKQKANYLYLTNYLEERQSEGMYSFTFSDLLKNFSVRREALKAALNRLVRKGRIVSARKGFYVIVPPEYSQRGILPPSLFINDLMDFLSKPYYIGLLSAAAMHGAGHQQPQEFYVITVKPAMRPITCKDIKINFNVKSSLFIPGLEKRKTDTGFIKVSNPELTALDLIQFENRIGGLDRVVTLLDELAEKFNRERLQQLLSTNISTAYLQRFGFILDQILELDDLAQAVFENLKKRNRFRVPLKTSTPKSGFPVNGRWKIIENANLESEL
ncbi:MAG: type IV toxin-antitoxin system AbiEi family antitoxin [bacterium]